MQSKRKGVNRAFPGVDRLAWPGGLGIPNFWVIPNFSYWGNTQLLLSHTQLLFKQGKPGSVFLFASSRRCAGKEAMVRVKTQSSIRATKRKYFRLIILGYCFRWKWFSSPLDMRLLWIVFSTAGEGVALTWSSVSSDPLWNPQATFTIQNLAFGHRYL